MVFAHISLVPIAPTPKMKIPTPRTAGECQRSSSGLCYHNTTTNILHFIFLSQDMGATQSEGRMPGATHSKRRGSILVHSIQLEAA
eukprot:1901275-Amphidinium_carterae.1